jgi:hypothetical protein
MGHTQMLLTAGTIFPRYGICGGFAPVDGASIPISAPTLATRRRLNYI